MLRNYECLKPKETHSMAKKKAAKRKAAKSRPVSQSVKQQSPSISTYLKTLSVKGSATQFAATKTKVDDPSGMGMDTWTVEATLDLDYDKAVERLDEMEPPTGTLSTGDIFDLLSVAGSDDKQLKGKIEGVATEPAWVEATFRFRSLPQKERVVF